MCFIIYYKHNITLITLFMNCITIYSMKQLKPPHRFVQTLLRQYTVIILYFCITLATEAISSLVCKINLTFFHIDSHLISQ